MIGLNSLRRAVVACVLALVVLGLGWELWWVPQRPGGSLLALKVLPLLAALPAFMKGRVRAYQWWSMLILIYLCEGLVRGMSDLTALGRGLGWVEVALSLAAYGFIVAYIRAAQADAKRAGDSSPAG